MSMLLQMILSTIYLLTSSYPALITPLEFPSIFNNHSQYIYQLQNANLISGNILTQILDHLPQFLILKNANIAQNKLAVSKSDYSNYNEENFAHDFNQIEFNYLNDSLDTNNKYNQRLKDITSLVEHHVPPK